MLLSWHRPLRLSALVAVIVAIIQLTLDRVDFFLLIGERFASMMNEDRSSVAILLLRDLPIEVEPALLQFCCAPFPIWRVGRGKGAGAGCFWADRLAVGGCALAISCGDENRGNRDCQ